MRLLRLLPLLVILLLPDLPGTAGAANSDNAGAVWLLDLKGVLGPATSDYLSRGIEDAGKSGARAVVIRIDTPGGLDLSMRNLIRTILASPVPVIGYVTPSGARAASAGTYVLYACHVAAMSPATNLGAATPVQIASPISPSSEPQTQPSGTRSASGSDHSVQPSTPMERKIVNDAVAYIRGLAELRGRNGDWAERAVRQGVSLPASEALKMQVVDYIASDLDDLFRQLDGRHIQLQGREITLHLSGAPRIEHRPDWRSEFLAVITDPNVAYVLMLLGIYGLIFEFSNPGMTLPGIVGAVCILLALYAFQVLPVSYAGLGLIILGIGLMVAEAFAPSFGVLGLGGIAAFIVGSIILMDTQLPGYRIALPVILALAVSSGGLLAIVLGLIWRVRRRAAVSGPGALIGQHGVVEQLHEGHPLVRLRGELWQSDCTQPLQPGDRVRVLKAEGVHLTVEKWRDKT